MDQWQWVNTQTLYYYYFLFIYEQGKGQNIIKNMAFNSLEPAVEQASCVLNKGVLRCGYKMLFKNLIYLSKDI